MTRYQLDDLGWYQFESLVQALLKAELGIGVESWGGQRDYGIDAYIDNPLFFPTSASASDGPFIFQVKFIENANAKGSQPASTVRNAVANELSRIRKRVKEMTWENPKHYVFVTNAPVNSSDRRKHKTTISETLKDTTPHFMDGSDVSDLLDNNPNLRKAFPQLLSLRDIDTMLSCVVNRHILEASEASIAITKDYSSAFVPTTTYFRAWDALKKHSFCVLEGPPEMGKTATAWMIGLTQLTGDWQLISCDSPDDFYSVFSGKDAQIFIADDAFGRTEYDPSRGALWERHLHRIIPRLDKKHWLIWTSRRHILERAVRKMDLQGRAANYPSPASVIVDASRLSIEEKALILYRHAKFAKLDEAAKTIVKTHALPIVRNKAFTPERIRRFIQESLPDLVTTFKDTENEDELTVQVLDSIRHPTTRMRKTFDALSASHKWCLLSLLEIEGLATLDKLESLFVRREIKSGRLPFRQVIEELNEAFVSVKNLENPKLKGIVDWIHPSYRDLVIDELTNDPDLRRGFLRTMSLEGLKLAISELGGESGEREIPLLLEPEDFGIFEERCVKVVKKSSQVSIQGLLEVFLDFLDRDHDDRRQKILSDIIRIILIQVSELWSENDEVIDPDMLHTFCSATAKIYPLIKLPDLLPTWQFIENQFRVHLADVIVGEYTDPDLLQPFLRLIEVIKMFDPRFLLGVGFPANIQGEMKEFLETLDCYEIDDQWLDEGFEYRNEAENMASLAEIAREVASHYPFLYSRGREISERLDVRSLAFEEEALLLEYEPDEDDRDWDMPLSFDVPALFQDL